MMPSPLSHLPEARLPGLRRIVTNADVAPLYYRCSGRTNEELACIRCPMLRLDLAQVPRLLQIETDTRERLDEARRIQWLGEVAALEESLRHIDNKKHQADRLREGQAGLGEDFQAHVAALFGPFVGLFG